MTLADAAAEADAFAEEGKERELSQLRAQWDEELESAARGPDFRERDLLSAIAVYQTRARRFGTVETDSPDRLRAAN